jgi:hypothetical protein
VTPEEFWTEATLTALAAIRAALADDKETLRTLYPPGTDTSGFILPLVSVAAGTVLRIARREDATTDD